MQTVYLISGPLGVGKSTISKNLVNSLDNCILIDGDSIFHPILSMSNLSWEEKLKLTWEKIILVTKNHLNHNLNVVIDFVVENELDWFYDEVHKPGIEIKFVILTADEDTIKNRLAGRGSTDDLRRSLTLLDQIKKGASNNKYILDTTGKDITEIVNDILTLTNNAVKPQETK